MKELKSKYKRIQPIIKVRQVQVDHETMILAKIRESKQRTMDALRKYQDSYMKGVEDANQVRQSGDTTNLGTLESGLDFIKYRWYETLRELRGHEEKEKIQISQLLSAQKDLKSIELLSDKYQNQIDEILRIRDQQAMDDIAIDKFVRKANSAAQ